MIEHTPYVFFFFRKLSQFINNRACFKSIFIGITEPLSQTTKFLKLIVFLLTPFVAHVLRSRPSQHDKRYDKTKPSYHLIPSVMHITTTCPVEP